MSLLWCQIHADVLDPVIEQVADLMHAQLRGAALVAARALGLLSTTDAAAAVPVVPTFVPDPGARAQHDTRHAQFHRLHPRRKKLFAALNR